MIKFNSFLITAILLIPITTAGWDDTDWNNAYNNGKAAGTVFGKKVDEPEEINTRFIQPIISSGTPMQSLDGSVSFDAQLSAPSSDAFLEIMVVPSKTGDLTTVLVKQDTDFDGIPDYTYSVPVQISGICANGFISADAGSWNNRHYYTWITSSTGKVIITEQPSILNLSACYCINASCGSNLVWSNIGVVLRDIGTGIISAIQKTHPGYTITNVDIADTAITYYGQDSQKTGAAADVYAGGIIHPEIYANAPEKITGAGETEFNNQISHTDSYAYLVLNASDRTTNTVNCVIWNDIKFNQETFNISNSGSSTWGTDHLLHIQIKQENDKILYQWLNTGSNINEVCRHGCGPCDWTNIGIIDTKNILYANPNSYKYRLTANMQGHGCFNGSAYINYLGQSMLDGACPGDNCQKPTVNWSYSLDGIHDNPQLIFNNTCGTIDDSCSLMEEKICDRTGSQCVFTVKNFIPTGLSPFSFCSTISTSLEFYTVCMDGTSTTIKNSLGVSTVLGQGNNTWWRIERIYHCESSANSYSFNNIGDRVAHIHNTLSDNITNLTYQDINTNTGEVTSYNIDLPPRTDPDPCEKACKLRIPIQDTQAAEPGHTAQYRISTDSFQEIVRRCWDNVCAVKTGETLIQDCTCLDYFLEAASIMQAIDEAGSDIICSE